MFNFQAMLPHVYAVLVIIAAVMVYCSPLLKGRVLVQNDTVKNQALSQESKEYREETGEEILWTSRVFSGMTTFNMNAEFHTNIMSAINSLKFALPKGANLIIISCIGFYLLMLMLGLSPPMALIAAITYGLSSNLLSSLNAGHNTKVLTIAYMAPAIGGVITAFRGKWFAGAVITALFIGLMINSNHYQIIYYFLLVSFIGGLIYLIFAIREKAVKPFLRTALILVAAGAIGFLPNFSKIYNVYTHSKETIRGGSKYLSTKDKKDEGGLDRSYAMSWSMGIMESFSVVVPSFYGGSSAEVLPENGAVAELVGRRRNPEPLRAPTYIGDQPFLQGVIYFGAGFIFLFFLSLFVVDRKIKTWMLTIIVLSFFIAWGRHFSVFTNILFDYFPLYNKFRTPSMALCIAGIAIPLMGMLALGKVASKEKMERPDFMKAFKYAIYITGGLMTLLLLYGLTNEWTGPKDVELRSSQPWDNDRLFEALLEDRKSLYLRDWFVSFLVMAVTAVSIWLYQTGKLRQNLALLIIGLFFVGDMWRVSKRYLNDDSFVVERNYDAQFDPTPADRAILQDPDPHYRVINLTLNPWTDGMTCYHHENIGGHHAAKIQRYQDMIENHLGSQLNLLNKVIVQGPQGLSIDPNAGQALTAYNMLNTKYFIVRKNENGVVRNPLACGNAWFVRDVQKVASHDDEMSEVGQIDPLETAVMHEEFSDAIDSYNFGRSANAGIELTDFVANHLTYESNNDQDGLAVFSEVYYTNGWHAYIDGEPAEIMRANYLLRAMKIPKGKHVVEMKFEPSSYALGEGVSLAGSSIFVLFAGGLLFYLYRRRKESTVSSED